jgi:low affinity Fe/Cu permease
VHDFFHKIARGGAAAIGSAWAFVGAILICVTWAATGAFFRYSQNWQFFMTSGTSIATFLMIFLVQNSQNRDTKAMLLKLDELIRAQQGARNGLINLEGMTNEQFQELEAEFKRLRALESGAESRSGIGSDPKS